MQTRNLKEEPSSDTNDIEEISEKMIPGWTADKIVVNGQLMTIVYPKDSKQLYT